MVEIGMIGAYLLPHIQRRQDYLARARKRFPPGQAPPPGAAPSMTDDQLLTAARAMLSLDRLLALLSEAQAKPGEEVDVRGMVEGLVGALAHVGVVFDIRWGTVMPPPREPGDTEDAA